jgi:hypothetical protein
MVSSLTGASGVTSAVWPEVPPWAVKGFLPYAPARSLGEAMLAAAGAAIEPSEAGPTMVAIPPKVGMYVVPGTLPKPRWFAARYSSVVDQVSARRDSLSAELIKIGLVLENAFDIP